jgi:hypothetical protein
MREESLRQAIVRWGRSLFERGLTGGSSGNISVKHDDFYLMTPANSCLGFLDPERLPSSVSVVSLFRVILRPKSSRFTSHSTRRVLRPVRLFTCIRRTRPLCLVSTIPILTMPCRRSHPTWSCGLDVFRSFRIPDRALPTLRSTFGPRLAVMRQYCWATTVPLSPAHRSKRRFTPWKNSRRPPSLCC